MNRLFLPFRCGLRHRFFPDGRVSGRTILVTVFGAVLFAAVYLASLQTVNYFYSQNELGVILALKIFEMAWIIVFSMLIFSSTVTGVSALFLSRDNEIIFAAPVPLRELFRMRYATASLYSSWMMVVFSLPVFGAYGQVFQAGPGYYLLLVPAVVCVAAMATALGQIVTILLVHLFPARRTKDIVVYLSLLFGILLYLVIRLLRPEELADPEKFPDFIEYLNSLSVPAAPFIPPGWASALLTGYLQDHAVDWILAGLLLTTPFVFYYAGEWLMLRVFFRGYSKAQESFGGYRTFAAHAYSPSPLRWLLLKEMKMFVRDSSQWSQLFLIGALVVVYLYNFKVLPLEQTLIPAEAVANIIAYANIGLTGFIIASLCARFVFPSIGAEGSGFGLLLTSPLPISRYILYKYIIYAVPFTVLTIVLLAASNHLLQISGPMWWVSLTTGMLISLSVVALALGFGAAHADFKAENQAAVLGSFGAILYLFTALSYELAAITAFGIPAYRLVRSWRWDMHFSTPVLLQTSLTFLGILLVSGLIIFLSLKKGMEKITGNYH
jgi:ABC-2 type transport system permease protein